MTGWRAKAAETLPELSVVLDGGWSVHVFLGELHELVRDAHRTGDEDIIARGYRFAYWCLSAPEKFLSNAAAVSFYEHVFDDWEMRHEAAGHLSPDVATQVRPLWEWRLPLERMAEVDQLFGTTPDRLTADR